MTADSTCAIHNACKAPTKSDKSVKESSLKENSSHFHSHRQWNSLKLKQWLLWSVHHTYANAHSVWDVLMWGDQTTNLSITIIFITLTSCIKAMPTSQFLSTETSIVFYLLANKQAQKHQFQMAQVTYTAPQHTQLFQSRCFKTRPPPIYQHLPTFNQHGPTKNTFISECTNIIQSLAYSDVLIF